VPPTESERMRGLEIAGEVGIGAAQGYGELAWDATRELLLTWATGGFYQAIQGYHFYSALYAGYDEKGWLGALSVLNPLAGILTPAENATHEAIKSDYRAAGKEGIKSPIAAVVTVVTVAIVKDTLGITIKILEECSWFPGIYMRPQATREDSLYGND
jgi:hypothetical protein